MNGNLVVAIVGILGALILAVRGVQSRRESPRRLLMTAGIWVFIIIAVMFIVHYAGLVQPA